MDELELVFNFLSAQYSPLSLQQLRLAQGPIMDYFSHVHREKNCSDLRSGWKREHNCQKAEMLLKGKVLIF